MEIDEDFLAEIENSLEAMTQYADSYAKKLKSDPHSIHMIVAADVKRAEEKLEKIREMFGYE